MTASTAGGLARERLRLLEARDPRPDGPLPLLHPPLDRADPGQPWLGERFNNWWTFSAANALLVLLLVAMGRGWQRTAYGIVSEYCDPGSGPATTSTWSSPMNP